WRNLPRNLAQYPSWILQTETPIVLLALIAPFLVGSRNSEGNSTRHRRAIAVMWVSFITAVFLSYLFYEPYDQWFWLRFLLPAFPVLFVLTSIGLVAVLAGMKRGVRVPVVVVVIGLVAWHGVRFSLARSVFEWD